MAVAEVARGLPIGGGLANSLAIWAQQQGRQGFAAKREFAMLRALGL